MRDILISRKRWKRRRREPPLPRLLRASGVPKRECGTSVHEGACGVAEGGRDEEPEGGFTDK